MKEKRGNMKERMGEKENLSGRSLCRPRCCSSVAAPLRGCSLLTPRGQPKSPSAPSAAIYEMTSDKNPARQGLFPAVTRALFLAPMGVNYDEN